MNIYKVGIWIVVIIFLCGVLWGQYTVKVVITENHQTFTTKEDLNIINTNIIVMDSNCNKVGSGQDTVSVRIVRL